MFGYVIHLLHLQSAAEAAKRPCQEAVKRFFEFTDKADYASGITIPMGSEITFVYESYLGLIKFNSQEAFDRCDMDEGKNFGAPGSGHIATTLPQGSHYFCLDEWCGRGRKVKVDIVKCAPCKIIYLDTPFGFEIFEKNGKSKEWVSKIGGHIVRLKKDMWELNVERHTFTTSAKDALDHPPRKATWHHSQGLEFEIVLHCDRCEDDPRMECASVIDVYCMDETYSTLMRMYCPRFCGFCGLMQKAFALTTTSIEVHTNVKRRL